MRTLLLLIALALPVAAAGKMDPDDERALRAYELTTGKIEKLVKIGDRMRDYVKVHPEARRGGGFLKGDRLDDRLQALESTPYMMEMLNAEKITPRDFMLGTLTLLQTGMLMQIRAQHPDSPVPDDVNQKNLELISKHADLMQKWRTAWQIGMGPQLKDPNAEVAPAQ
jgi:hypothetical protein